MIDLIAYCTPLLAVLVFLLCLVLIGVIIAEGLTKELNEAFQKLNGETE